MEENCANRSPPTLENAHRLRQGKAALIKINNTKRPALNKVGNKLTYIRNHVDLKKPGPLKTNANDAALKPAQKPKDKIAIETNRLKKNNIVNKEKPKVIKQQESNLLPVMKAVAEAKPEASYSSQQLIAFIDVDKHEVMEENCANRSPPALENAHRLRQGKAALIKINNTKRPALNEVGNKLTYIRNHVDLKKPGPLKTNANDAALKPAQKPKDKIAIETNRLKKNNIVNKEKPKVIKQQESNLLPVVKAVAEAKPEASYSSQQLIAFIDVDKHEADPMLVPEYVKGIFKYLRSLEDKYLVKKDYLGDGHVSNARMRSVLINWMSEVQINFKFLIETLHLSVSIMDRYLQANKNIGRETLQLVGTTATIIAAKYEEMYVPDLSDFVYICNDLFSKKEIMKMECDILKRLDFSLGKPSSILFLRRYNRIVKATPQQHMLGKYLIELVLVEYNICHIKSSEIAAAACCLSISILDQVQNPARLWTRTVKHFSGYDYDEIKGTISKLCCALIRAETSKYQAVRTKYSTSSMRKISLNSKLKDPLVKKLAAQAVLLKK